MDPSSTPGTNPFAPCKPGKSKGELVLRGPLPRVWSGTEWFPLLDGVRKGIIDLEEIADLVHTVELDSLAGCPAGFTESIRVWKGKGTRLVVLDLRECEGIQGETLVEMRSVAAAIAEAESLL